MNVVQEGIEVYKELNPKDPDSAALFRKWITLDSKNYKQKKDKQRIKKYIENNLEWICRKDSSFWNEILDTKIYGPDFLSDETRYGPFRKLMGIARKFKKIYNLEFTFFYGEGAYVLGLRKKDKIDTRLKSEALEQEREKKRNDLRRWRESDIYYPGSNIESKSAEIQHYIELENEYQEDYNKRKRELQIDNGEIVHERIDTSNTRETLKPFQNFSFENLLDYNSIIFNIVQELAKPVGKERFRANQRLINELYNAQDLYKSLNQKFTETENCTKFASNEKVYEMNQHFADAAEKLEDILEKCYKAAPELEIWQKSIPQAYIFKGRWDWTKKDYEEFHRLEERYYKDYMESTQQIN